MGSISGIRSSIAANHGILVCDNEQPYIEVLHQPVNKSDHAIAICYSVAGLVYHLMLLEEVIGVFVHCVDPLNEVLELEEVWFIISC